MADQLMAMTGMDAAQAQQYLDMAGGDVEGAVNLFFSMMDQGGAAGGGGAGDSGAPASAWPAYVDGFVASRGSDLGANWLEQGLTFSEQAGERACLLQAKNGPCGVLAVINAVLIAQRLKAGADLDAPVTDDELAAVLAAILSRCAANGGAVTLCDWEDRASGAVKSTTVEAAGALGAVRDQLDAFRAPGGVLLVILSCLETKGVDKARAEVASAAGEPPLIVGPNQLCSSELVKLLMCGNADGSFGAYKVMGGDGKVPPFETVGGIGMLSFSELESGIPVHDSLKAPPTPVWVLHSGDHFTIAFRPEMSDSAPPLELVMYNGLPPGGPRAVKVLVEGDSVAGPAADKRRESFFKRKPGEVEDVVQASPTDKAARPEQWKTWEYEVVLAVEDDSVTGPERPADAPAPRIFDLGKPGTGAWRCASCYRTRFKTMCFGQNDPSTATCAHCGLSREAAQWSLWLPYAELPAEWRTKMDLRHAPKAISILTTKWPGCSLRVLSSSRTDQLALPSV